MNVDVLVIGCGPGGASAAIAAHDAGASVLVVEKHHHGGGNALFAGGFLWDVRGPEAVRHVQTLFFGKTDPSVAQAYVAGLNDLPTWVAKLGGEVVGVDPPPGSFPAVIPSWPHVPGGDGVRYWVVGGQPSLRRGEALWFVLAENLSARGITIRHGHPAACLTVAEDGRVTGAMVGSELVTAARGVILACGGFEADEYFKDAFLPVPRLLTRPHGPSMLVDGPLYQFLHEARNSRSLWCRISGLCCWSGSSLRAGAALAPGSDGGRLRYSARCWPAPRCHPVMSRYVPTSHSNISGADHDHGQFWPNTAHFWPRS